MSSLVTYTRYHSEEDAQFLTTLLLQHSIPYSLEHEVNQIDKIYIGESIDPMYILRVPNDRFNDVNALLAEQAAVDMERPDFEHYLQSYEASELRDIVRNPDGWNAYDLAVAKKLLAGTGGEMPVQVISRKDAVGESAASYVPEKMDSTWIVLGYLVCCMAFTNFIFLGAGGFFAGLAILQSKKTLRNGDVVKTYRKEDRQHGKYMMVLSVAMLAAGLFAFFYRGTRD